MRRTLPMVITLVTGLIVILRDLFVNPALASFVADYVARSVALSTASASALGLITLARLHFNRVRRQREGWYNSLILLFGLFWFLIMGLILEKGQNNPFYNYFYNMIPVNLSAMMFALLCFYIASSAYRAFRMRSLEASLLLISAILVMLGGVTIGNAIWTGLPDLKTWIMTNFNQSTIRGIGLGVTLGALAQAARNLLGIERGYMAE